MFEVTDREIPSVALAVDSTGLKQHNSGEWIGQKWKVRRGFVKLHVLVDTDTRKILAIRVPTTGRETLRCRFPCLTNSWGRRKEQTDTTPRFRGWVPVRGCCLRLQRQREGVQGTWPGSANQAQGKLDCARKEYGRRMGHGGPGSAWRIGLQPHRGAVG